MSLSWAQHFALHQTAEGPGASYRNSAINGYIGIDSESESGGKPL
jgi:hypothetical protein